MVAALTPPVTGTTRVFAAIAEQLAMEVSVDDDIDDSQAKDDKLPFRSMVSYDDARVKPARCW